MVTIFGHLSRAGMLTSTCLSRDKYNCCARDVSISISCSFDTGVFRRVSLFCYWLRADFTDFLSSSDIRDRVAALITASVGYRDIISSSILRSHFIRKLQDVFLFHRHYTRSTLTGNGKWWHYLASRRQDPGFVRTIRQEALDLLRTTRSRSIVAGDEVLLFVFLFKTRDSRSSCDRWSGDDAIWWWQLNLRSVQYDW